MIPLDPFREMPEQFSNYVMKDLTFMNPHNVIQL